MYRQVPNLITVARLALTAVFFIMINLHGPVETFRAVMYWAFVVYLVAVGTDWLDGYLARTWKAESAFGRVVDPFVDKILVGGAFIFFSSTGFMHPRVLADWTQARHDLNVTGVAPWMAVVLIAREFLVTGIRGLAEGQGIKFGSDWAGKIKLGVQAFAIGAVIVDVAEAGTVNWVRFCRDASIWLTLVVTVLSALGYIARARRTIRG